VYVTSTLSRHKGTDNNTPLNQRPSDIWVYETKSKRQNRLPGNIITRTCVYFVSPGRSPGHPPMASANGRTWYRPWTGQSVFNHRFCVSYKHSGPLRLGFSGSLRPPLQWAGSTRQGGQVVQCAICHIASWMKLNAHYTRCVTTLMHRTNGLVCRSSALGHRTYGTRMGRAKISQGRLTSTNPTSQYG